MSWPSSCPAIARTHQSGISRREWCSSCSIFGTFPRWTPEPSLPPSGSVGPATHWWLPWMPCPNHGQGCHLCLPSIPLLKRTLVNRENQADKVIVTLAMEIPPTSRLHARSLSCSHGGGISCQHAPPHRSEDPQVTAWKLSGVPSWIKAFRVHYQGDPRCH